MNISLPVVYGLALYNTYEQIFTRVKGKKSEQVKMKLYILSFSGINLAKASALRNSVPVTVVHSTTAKDLQKKLRTLTQRLSLQIGDNYMKRSHYYLVACIIGLLVSLVGLISANSDVSFKDLITFNFILYPQRIKEILTYIFSTMLVFSVSLLVFSIGFNKKQREDISQIKKYALYELLASVKRQKSQLMEYPPIDDPAVLYASYILNTYEVKQTCDKVLSSYANLLTTWECDVVKRLQLYATSIINDLGICAENINQYNALSFCPVTKPGVTTGATMHSNRQGPEHGMRPDERKENHERIFCLRLEPESGPNGRTVPGVYHSSDRTAGRV